MSCAAAWRLAYRLCLRKQWQPNEFVVRCTTEYLAVRTDMHETTAFACCAGVRPLTPLHSDCNQICATNYLKLVWDIFCSIVTIAAMVRPLARAAPPGLHFPIVILLRLETCPGPLHPKMPARYMDHRAPATLTEPVIRRLLR